ncbi:MAG: Rpn family recombination-promoting nuclease/putative transposase, partial [Acidaminococcaceae bacterium]|nr:Rpn family recombination-promoting nuclease/putative transposase [Acidaminococcaceae bacterium]
QKGQPYDLLPPTFIIFICVFDFFEKGNYVYTLKKRCLENLELELPDEATTMILNTKGTHGDISKDIKSFYDYVNNHIVTTDFTKQIDDEISYLKLDTKVRREFMLMEARLLDERREGIAEGKEIGLAEGEAIGLVKGEAEHKLKVAKLMLAKDCYSLQEITELSGLSLADVEKLKEEA